jgi:hypothetical protein
LSHELWPWKLPEAFDQCRKSNRLSDRTSASASHILKGPLISRQSQLCGDQSKYADRDNAQSDNKLPPPRPSLAFTAILQFAFFDLQFAIRSPDY